MKSVRISIIIPVYNSEEYLDKCLSSIVQQDMNSYEVILVDDGSTDSSPLICERYSATNPHFKSITKSNGGVSSARNVGLGVADGEYILFVDSDDALAPGALSALDAAIADKPDFVVAGFNIYNENILYATVAPKASSFYPAGKMDSFLTDTMRRNGAMYRGPWAKLYRNNVIRRNKIRFNESLCYAEDKLFIYDFLKHVTSAVSVKAPVYEYYRRVGTLSGGKTTERRTEQLLAVVPLLVDSLVRLEDMYPENKALKSVYHCDLICCDLMRVLRYFMKHRTALLTEDNISEAYRVLSYDSMLRVFERKVPGQVLNVILYKIGCVSFTKFVFKLSSSILNIFHA